MDTCVLAAKVTGRHSVWERLAKLLNHPLRGRAVGRVKMQGHAPAVVDDKPTVQYANSYRWNGAEIPRRDAISMVSDECEPPLNTGLEIVSDARSKGAVCRFGVVRKHPGPVQVNVVLGK